MKGSVLVLLMSDVANGAIVTGDRCVDVMADSVMAGDREIASGVVVEVSTELV